MYGRLLVPLDGSQDAESALRFAELIPSSTIRLITVEPVKLTAARSRWARGEVPPSGGTWDVTKPSAYLDILAVPLRGRGRTVEVTVITGVPGPAIVDAAHDVDLIVMAMRGDGVTPALVGGTADHVARHAPVPTLLVRDVPATPIERLLVPLDGSERSEEAIPLAATIGRQVGAAILLVRVIDPSTSIAPARELQDEAETYLRRQATQIRDVDRVGYDVLVRRAGTVAECLLGLARPGDLFVLASRRRTRIAQLLLGSVTASIVRSAPIPVVLVPGIPRGIVSALHAAAHGPGHPDAE